jgi:DNA-directed RNA polymerase specialized sigma24 family protein
MNQDDRPDEDDSQDELCAAFAALGGRLTWDELTRLLGSDEYYDAVVRLAALLLGGKTPAAVEVVRASFAALRQARSRLGDPEEARVWLCREVVSRSRSVYRRQAADDGHAPQPASDGSGAGLNTVGVGRDAGVYALRALPKRQREAVMLHACMGLSERQAAEVMCISTGAVRSHLARGMSSLRRLPGPE